jgi:hypothetical protein
MGVGTEATGGRYGDVASGQAAQGRRDVTTARAARGARGVGEEGGAAQGGPTARRPTDRDRPRRAVQWDRGAADARTPAPLWSAKG